jgi:7-cyano-7-deazaguanine reductase
MTNQNIPIEAKVLGQKVEYPSTYAPEILVAVPRRLNREQYQLHDDHLPFKGVDVWHAYELGFLTLKGLPVTGVLKLVYPADSASLVESKSIKLYLNGFNMFKIGDKPNDGITLVIQLIKQDLEKLLNTTVQLSFHQSSHPLSNNFNDYSLLEEMNDVENLRFDHFTESPEILDIASTEPSSLKLATHLLRSNCKITHQPDWGSAFIHIKSNVTPDLASILKYLVSFRNENHFHEEICEMIYKRLWDKYKPEELMVTCIYTRRGGIDICPVRASDQHLFPKQLASPEQLSEKLLRQ